MGLSPRSSTQFRSKRRAGRLLETKSSQSQRTNVLYYKKLLCDIFKRQHIKERMHFLFSAVILIAAIFTFPLGLDSKFARHYCPGARMYNGGTCHVGWAYILGVMATALSIFCPFLSQYTDFYEDLATPLIAWINSCRMKRIKSILQGGWYPQKKLKAINNNFKKNGMNWKLWSVWSRSCQLAAREKSLAHEIRLDNFPAEQC